MTTTTTTPKTLIQQTQIYKNRFRYQSDSSASSVSDKKNLIYCIYINKQNFDFQLFFSFFFFVLFSIDIFSVGVFICMNILVLLCHHHSFYFLFFFFISQTINHRFLYYLYIENKIRNKTTTTKTKWNIIPNVSSTIYKFIIYLFKKKIFVMFKSEKLSDVLIIRKFGVFFFLLFHFFLTDVIYITLVYMTKKKTFLHFIYSVFFFFFHHHHFKFIV